MWGSSCPFLVRLTGLLIRNLVGYRGDENVCYIDLEGPPADDAISSAGTRLDAGYPFRLPAVGSVKTKPRNAAKKRKSRRL